MSCSLTASRLYFAGDWVKAVFLLNHTFAALGAVCLPNSLRGTIEGLKEDLWPDLTTPNIETLHVIISCTLYVFGKKKKNILLRH